MRHSVLIRALKKRLPDIPPNTIATNVSTLVTREPGKVYKPSRGLLMSVKFRDAPSPGKANRKGGSSVAPLKEEDFYAGFAAYLTEDLEECTKAVPLGGALFKDKWGTPDVIGIRKAFEGDLIKFPTEIVSAEIKTDSNNLITAFGQAVAYKLFSHKSYIVVPRASSPEDLDRLEALCLTCGLGLIHFDHQSVENPNFTIRVRAIKSEPDSFYVNKNLKPIGRRLFD